MSSDLAAASLPEIARLPTNVPGLDVVLGGGLFAGDAYLVSGYPGTGKTTLGAHLAFAHASAEGSALIVTLLTESHDRLLGHLRGFAFADPALIGSRLRLVSLLGALEEGGLEGLLDGLTEAMREHRATLVIVDGARAAGMLAGSGFRHGRFVHGLQARSALTGCTTVLLSAPLEAIDIAPHVDGVVELENAPVDQRDLRSLRVAKLRGSAHLSGRHVVMIAPSGFNVFPRLEAVLHGQEPRFEVPSERVQFGVLGLDAMLGGGVPLGSSTLLLGTPGAGKTLHGLSFLAEGARQGERGLVAAFQETAPALVAAADRLGFDLGRHIESGLVRVLWQSPLELNPDQWAWELLDAVDAHRPRRLVVDAITDFSQLLEDGNRQPRFFTALTNAIRDRGATALYAAEIDAFVDARLTLPIPNVSAPMDNTILLRQVELRSTLRRLVSIQKERQSDLDSTIREFTIDRDGIAVGGPLPGVGTLTGNARPLPE